jgi:hypothetical protein
MAAQHIGAREFTAPVDLVRWMLALQGQEYAGVRWSVGLRCPAATEADIRSALDAGEIVRSWPLRGTLHLVAADDLGWMLSLTAPRMAAAATRRRAALEITATDIERAREAAVAALTGTGSLPRRALLQAIAAHGVKTAGQRGYHILWHLSQTATLVLGPTDGREQTFALLDAWVRHPRRLERDEALGELARRYVRGHGPTTDRDLARWTGLTLADVRRGLAIAGPELTTVDIGGSTYHVASETLAPGRRRRRAHLLPGFDEYLLGYQDRSFTLTPEHRDAIVPGGNGVFRPTIVLDGEVIGTWARNSPAGDIVIEPALFGRPTAENWRAIEQAAAAYGRFIGQSVRLSRTGRDR